MEYRWKLLILTTIGVFMMSLDGSILNIAIYPLSLDLKPPAEVIQWIPIIYLLVMAITLIGFGRLADLKGKNKFFILGLIVFTLGSLFSAIAWSGEILVFFRAIQAIGASLIGATSIAMVTEVFPRETGETGKALGINVAGIYLGLVLGPVLGGFLVQTLTWRSIFYINLPIGIVLIILSHIHIKESENIAKGEKFDPVGTIIFGIFLASLLLALTLGNTFGWFSIFIIILFIITIFSFLVFIRIEKNAKYPMLNLDLFLKNRVFAAANAAALLNYIATMGVSFWLAIYLQSIKGLEPIIAGLLLLPTSLMMAIMSPLTGKYSDKAGSRYICASGMIIMAISISILILVLLFLPIQFILISQFLLGIGIGLFSSPNQSAIMKSVEKKQLGIASGTLSTMRVTGQSISLGLISAILASFILPSLLNMILSHGTVSLPAEAPIQFLNGLVAAFILVIIICIIGALLSLIRGKENKYDSILE
ncbi:MAG: MFS transporter [Candidatus Lokiarchaeota archaeon]|nr:MFS transporter [Candidatus Lokiarchaeota archaeon]